MGRLFRLTATIIAMIVVGLIGCSEQGTELPVTPGDLSMNPDSIALREARASGGLVEFGPARTHGTNGTNSDTMYLEAPSGFRVELVDSECGGTNVVMRVVNPADSLLGTAMCQQSVPSVWDFPGPYPVGTGIVLNVIPNFMTAVGEFRIKNGYPSWRVEVEAGLDQDFNDLVFDITPLADTTDIRCDRVTRGQETTCEVLATVDSVVEWRWVGLTGVGGPTPNWRTVRRCGFESVPTLRWSQKPPQRLGRWGVEASRIQRRFEPPSWLEGYV